MGGGGGEGGGLYAEMHEYRVQEINKLRINCSFQSACRATARRASRNSAIV